MEITSVCGISGSEVSDVCIKTETLPIQLQLPNIWQFKNRVGTKVNVSLSNQVNDQYALHGVVFLEDTQFYSISCGGLIAKIPKVLNDTLKIGENVEIGITP